MTPEEILELKAEIAKVRNLVYLLMGLMIGSGALEVWQVVG